MTILKIAELCGTDISSRSSAAVLRKQIVATIESTREAVQLDFTGVRTISDSFADELFGVLAQERNGDWFRQWIAICNIEPFPRDTVIQAIDHRLQAA